MQILPEWMLHVKSQEISFLMEWHQISEEIRQYIWLFKIKVLYLGKKYKDIIYGIFW